MCAGQLLGYITNNDNISSSSVEESKPVIAAMLDPQSLVRCGNYARLFGLFRKSDTVEALYNDGICSENKMDVKLNLPL